MIAWEVILYAHVYGVMLALSALGLESALVSPSLDRWNRRFFTAFFAILTLCSLSFFLELAVYVHPDLTLLEVVAYYVQSLLAVSLFPMLAAFLLHSCGEDWRRAPLFRAVLAAWIACVVLFSVSQFTPAFYSVGPAGQLILGPAYSALVLPLLAMLLLVAAGVVRRRGEMARRRYRALLICLHPLTLITLVHAVTPVFVLLNAGLAASAFGMYRVVESDMVERDLRQQREIASQRASIAVLQMRPHFIYNALTSIYYLCDQDPLRAKRVTMDFATYLRRSLDAIAGGDPIPFPEELEHTRAYLAAEQAQYEDDLVVAWDVPHTRFRIPPLTLQPIVENTVKHGMDPDSVPLHVWVRTRETDAGSEVVVEDDGPGFDAAVADDPRTTLANIWQRLEMMCGGSLDVAPREGGGAKVTLTVAAARVA